MQRILVVEDDFDIQELLQNFLQEAGYEVAVANDGVEALSLFADQRYDLIVLDIMLPKIDGYGVCELIRKQSDVPIIMLTALSGEEDQIRGLDLQVDDYITNVSKLVLSQKLPEALEAVQKEFSALESGYLVVPHYTDALRIPYNEILYVQHILRSSQIYTLRQGVIKDNRGLKTIYSVIGDKRFIYIDRSTFVNIDFIRELKGNEIILRTGESLAISRPMLANVKETIVRMWR